MAAATMSVKRLYLYIFASLAYFCLAGFGIHLLTSAYYEKQKAESEQHLREQTALVRNKIETTIFKDVFAAESLATVVALNPELAIANWHTIAAKTLEQSQLVRNLGLAPNDTISHVFPLEGNQRAIGFNFKSSPEQYATVVKARQSKKVVIAGPLELVQGGQAIIARFPLFDDYPINAHYWGTLSVVMDLATLYKQVGIKDTEHLHIALRGVNASGAEGEVFYGDASIFSNPDSTASIQLPNGRWQLAARYSIPSNHDDNAQLLGAISIAAAIILYFSVAILVRAYHLTKTMSLQDELTKLANRRYIMQRLNALVNDPQQEKKFAIISIDLNEFKQVNDNFGHAVGDALLVHVARELETALRDADVVARLGGDEFLVLLYRINDPDTVAQIVEKVRRHIESTPLAHGDLFIYPSLSCGYSCHTDQTLDIEALLNEADKRMYSDKAQQK
ncbi:diguanylate cyclase domain-containing protein [Pseudoalteromonas ruthenica]|uniref:diguanylate cyclase domain-containing protein n=1 Tax=Pseudoalteromonas ruthenica TaxID=151081 RepID=UPI001486FA92|nr:diguanylate cyclase [Pseudoalteromonas ruthenica]